MNATQEILGMIELLHEVDGNIDSQIGILEDMIGILRKRIAELETVIIALGVTLLAVSSIVFMMIIIMAFVLVGTGG